MDKSALLRLLPRDKNDVAGAASLIDLGFPVVEPVLPQLIDWLRTNGSPVDLALRPFFASLGERAVPVVRTVLEGKHELHQYTVLSAVLSKWPKHAVAQLVPDLERLVTSAGYYAVDLIAMELLARFNLSRTEWLLEWTQHKQRRLDEHSALLMQVRNNLEGSRAT